MGIHEYHYFMYQPNFFIEKKKNPKNRETLFCKLLAKPNITDFTLGKTVNDQLDSL